MSTFYNDNDPKVCAWLRELMAQGLITKGIVSETPIQELRPEDLAPFTRVHLFAGIAGWDYALQLAGWPADVPVWTGSCPCQPFSCAGQQRGTADERHLWPVMREFIAKCHPAIVFGEQVSSPLGRGWLSGVRVDLEALGYAAGASDLCAASAGAPHIRQRLYWMAHSLSAGLEKRGERQGVDQLQATERSGTTGGMEHAAGDGREQWGTKSGRWGAERRCDWSNFNIVHCRDGKARRFEPGSFPLAHGVPERVGLLRGYGNAIVPILAAEFIQASVEAIQENNQIALASNCRISDNALNP